MGREKILQSVKSEIPSVDKILEEAWNELKFTRNFVKKCFGSALILFEEKANEIYRDYEKKALVKLSEYWIELQKEEIKRRLKETVEQEDWENFIEKASEIFSEFGKLVQDFEKDMGNKRKARGGKSFEKIVLKLLNFIGVKCEVPR